jgi:hypothetical protein
LEFNILLLEKKKTYKTFVGPTFMNDKLRLYWSNVCYELQICKNTKCILGGVNKACGYCDLRYECYKPLNPNVQVLCTNKIYLEKIKHPVYWKKESAIYLLLKEI